MRLIGVDCATADIKIGVAVGDFTGDRIIVSEAFCCTKKDSAAAAISKRIQATPVDDVLLAIDAPLGWPKPLSSALIEHRAGEALNSDAHSMFRRETDLFIKRTVGKTPLDVGADRIARTAHAALCILADIRHQLDLPIPLAWESATVLGVSAIEVYPAATLVAHRLQSSGYKKREQETSRKNIITGLSSFAEFGDDVYDKMKGNGDILDAVVCLLAARDFTVGEAVPPVNRSLAEIEGWIWTRAPVR